MTDQSYSSDNTILSELGQRLVARRITLEFTQAEVAIQAGVSKHTIERLENGQSVQMTNFVRAIRALGLVERFALMLPKRESPLAQLYAEKKPRQRVRKKRDGKNGGEKETWKWGE